MVASVISSVGGTRIEPKDSYVFLRNTTAIFKTTFTSNGLPTTVDLATTPTAQIFQPKYLDKGDTSLPTVIAHLSGSLVPGQEHEYQFIWDIPTTTVPNDEYIIQYTGMLGGMTITFGDEYFTVTATPGQINIKCPSYATVDDVRMLKFNIDDYLPQVFAKDLLRRNQIIEYHLRLASTRLREELSLFKQRSNSENYRLFCAYYTIWSILLSSRGEDGSSVSDSNLATWASEWQRILSQEKREGQLQGIGLGRA